MHRNESRSRIAKAAVSAAVALAAHGAVSPAFGSTHTWLGAANSWGFIGATSGEAVWTGNGGGVNVPPNTVTTEVFIGNNGTVNLGGGAWAEGYLHIGQNGASMPGTGELQIDAGSMTVSQNIYVGDGAAGTLTINGGLLITSASKSFNLGGGTISTTGAPATLNITSGTIQLNNKSGILRAAGSPGTSTINMSGGLIDFIVTDNASTVTADNFNFSGGTINNVTKVDLTQLSGSGVINLRSNSGSTLLTINQATDTVFNGQIASAGTIGSGAGGTITKTGAGVLQLGPAGVLFVRTAYNLNGGTIKLGNNEQLASDGTINIASGAALDLNGFSQTFKVLSGPGSVRLGGGGTININISTSTAGAQFDGVISGAGGLTKAGSGSITLTGNHTYSGNTSISNGTVILVSSGTNPIANSASIGLTASGAKLDVTGVAGGFTLASAVNQKLGGRGNIYGNVTAPAGTTVSGSGTFNNSLNVNGATLAPGDGGGIGTIATLTAASLSLNNAALSWDLGAVGTPAVSTADKLVVTNPDALTLAGVSTFTLNNTGGLTEGTYTLLDYNGSPLADLSKFALSSPTLGSFSVSLVNDQANTSINLLVQGGVVASNSTWNVDASGNWSTAGNWSAGVPNAVDATANFGTAITSTQTVSVDSPQTAGTLNFSSPISYAIAGSSTLTLDVSSGQAAINVTSGTHTISAPVVLNDDATITSAAGTGVALSGNLTAAGKTITKAGAGSVQFENVRAAALNISAGSAKISAKGTPNSAAGTSVVGSLSIASGATLDLTNNSAVIDYTGPVGTLVDATRVNLQTGRLTTSSADSAHRLGYGDNAVLNKGTFAGQSVDSSSILIKYTYAGDANLDGQVDVTDLGALATNWQTSNVWTGGDFNYDGFVDVTDLGALATNWQAGVGSPLGPGSLESAMSAVGLGGTSVPEPATIGLIGISLAAAASRRRTRRA